MVNEAKSGVFRIRYSNAGARAGLCSNTVLFIAIAKLSVACILWTGIGYINSSFAIEVRGDPCMRSRDGYTGFGARRHAMIVLKLFLSCL